MSEITSVFGTNDFSLKKSMLGLVTALNGDRIIGGRVGALGGNQGANVSNGTDTSTTYRHKLPPMLVAATGIRFSFPNWRLFPGELDGANDITVTASLEYSGAIYQLFFKGQTSALIKPGAEVLCDPSGISLPVGAVPYIRVCVSVASAGQTWPLGRLIKSTVDGFWVGQDYTLPANTTGMANTANTLMYGPSGMYGSPTNAAVPSVLVEGDSLAAGVGDTSGGGDVNGSQGFLERALYGVVNWVTHTRASEQVAQYVAINNRRNANRLKGVTSVISEMGTNDIFAANVSLATLQSLKLQEWTIEAQFGAAVTQTTITPQTTSTDSWATTANQTLRSVPQEAVRVAFNDWLRAGAPVVNGAAVAIGTIGALLAGAAGHPLAGYYEIADIIETARNSGIWKTTGVANGYTSDGTHPLPAMVVLMVPAVVISQLK